MTISVPDEAAVQIEASAGDVAVRAWTELLGELNPKLLS